MSVLYICDNCKSDKNVGRVYIRVDAYEPLKLDHDKKINKEPHLCQNCLNRLTLAISLIY